MFIGMIYIEIRMGIRKKGLSRFGKESVAVFFGSDHSGDMVFVFSF